MTFHERQLSFDRDALAVASALAASSTCEYVLYENRGAIGWAENPCATVRATSSGAVLEQGDDVSHFPAGATGSVVDAVARALAALPSADWRAYGWAPFELSHVIHGSQELDPEVPVMHLAVPSREIRFEDGSVLLRALDPGDLDALELRLSEAILDAVAQPAAARDEVDADVQEHDAAKYRTDVALAVDEIRAGRLEKVILSRRVPVDGQVDIPATYLAGRRGNDPARSFVLNLGGWQAAGFSPEIVTRVTVDGEVTTQPLAGTRAFEGDPVSDLARRRELYSDPKEVFEHAISVRLSVDEMEAVCDPATVTVDDFMIIKERGSVQHLASKLTGQLAIGSSPWDALVSLFPAITASGIPKAPACELIARLEDGPRGLYSGAVLTVDADGSLDAALVLRSIYRRGDATWLRAGAGIVGDSRPERELEETREKLRSVSRHLVGSVAAERTPELAASGN
ncbi:salicylate synthase [Streptomyces sp. AP-93]|uniref:salicylate synthase n=1 Tax=Streptomyces sp. AP-93 TaxID=2929048 RepID=UPI001FAF697D|nr:salicylate synthase [Streptomyces sp. AP-93]MCJ0874445.1 salicylate synthase [Streptomyces sp. AP-93]